MSGTWCSAAMRRRPTWSSSRSAPAAVPARRSSNDSTETAAPFRSSPSGHGPTPRRWPRPSPPALAETGSNGGTIGASNGTPVRTMPRSLARTPNALTVTERELQILRGMTDGCSNLEIAKQLFVSEDTVKTHARRLFRKLGANDRAHAVALGMRYELVG